MDSTLSYLEPLEWSGQDWVPISTWVVEMWNRYDEALLGRLIAEEVNDIEDRTLIHILSPCVCGSMLLLLVWRAKEFGFFDMALLTEYRIKWSA